MFFAPGVKFRFFPLTKKLSMKNLKLHFLLFGAEAEINFRPPAAAVVRKHLGPMELLLPPPPGFYSMDPAVDGWSLIYKSVQA